MAFQQSALTAAAGGEHLVFLGEGLQGGEVDSSMMMAVSRFLQKHSKYISILVGGYPSFHQQPQPDAGKRMVLLFVWTMCKKVLLLCHSDIISKGSLHKKKYKI